MTKVLQLTWNETGIDYHVTTVYVGSDESPSVEEMFQKVQEEFSEFSSRKDALDYYTSMHTATTTFDSVDDLLKTYGYKEVNECTPEISINVR